MTRATLKSYVFFSGVMAVAGLVFSTAMAKVTYGDMSASLHIFIAASLASALSAPLCRRFFGGQGIWGACRALWGGMQLTVMASMLTIPLAGLLGHTIANLMIGPAYLAWMMFDYPILAIVWAGLVFGGDFLFRMEKPYLTGPLDVHLDMASLNAALKKPNLYELREI